MTSKYDLVDFQALDSSNPPYHCVGVAMSYTPQRRCRNPISQSNMNAAGAWIQKISQQRSATLDELEKVAGLCLCQRWHRNQARVVAKDWLEDINRRNIAESASTPQSNAASNTLPRTTRPTTSEDFNDLIQLQPSVTDLRRFQRIISAKNVHISALKQELDELRSGHNALRNHNADLTREGLRNNSQLQESRRSILQMEREATDKDTLISSLETEMQRTGRKLSRSEQNYQDLKYEKDILEETNTNLRAAYVILSQTSDGSNGELTRQLRQAEGRRQEIEVKVTKLESELRHASTKEQGLDHQVLQLKTELSDAVEITQSLGAKVIKLETDLDNASTREQDLQDKTAKLKVELEGAAGKARMLNVQVERLTRSLKDVAARGQDLVANATLLKEELGTSQDEVRLLNSKVAELINVLDGYKEKEQGLHDPVAQLKFELGGSGEKAQLLNARVVGLTKAVEDATAKEGDLETRITELSGTLNLAGTREQNLKSRIAELETRLTTTSDRAYQQQSAFQARIQEMESASQTHGNDHTFFNTDIGTSTEASCQAAQREHHLDSQTQALTQQLQHSLTQNQGLKARLAYLHTQSQEEIANPAQMWQDRENEKALHARIEALGRQLQSSRDDQDEVGAAMEFCKKELGEKRERGRLLGLKVLELKRELGSRVARELEVKAEEMEEGKRLFRNGWFGFWWRS